MSAQVVQQFVAASPNRSGVNRHRHEFNQISVGASRTRGGHRQRLTLFEKSLRKVLDRAGDHQPCVLQIEALCHGTGKVERFSHDHFTGRFREVKRDLVTKHMSIIVRGLQRMHTHQNRETP
jgi:hypothetical protein